MRRVVTYTQREGADVKRVVIYTNRQGGVVVMRVVRLTRSYSRAIN